MEWQNPTLRHCDSCVAMTCDWRHCRWTGPAAAVSPDEHQTRRSVHAVMNIDRHNLYSSSVTTHCHQHKGKERKGKEEYLYSAICTMCILKRPGMDHTVLPANTPCLPFLRKRSPDGATPNWGRRHPIAAYYSFIDSWRDGRLSWPGWLTYSGRFTHISGHPSATGRAQYRESSPAKDRRSTAVPCNQYSM